jgi:GNAT superfamily N-acetyltransferase
VTEPGELGAEPTSVPSLAVAIRRAVAADEPAVLALLAAAMDRPADERFRRLFRWKHHDSPFGPSPAWVAEVDGEVAGYRALLRWEFDSATGPQRAVRAVDTATHPDHQGNGIFRTLTLHALDAVGADAAFVFNTPNDKSRPGYLKMGWEPVGTLRPKMRPAGLTRIPAIVRGRVPASHWGQPTTAGTTATEAFADDRATEELLASMANSGEERLRTRRSPAYLRWRYDADLLGYRVLPLGRDIREGAVCFRLRRRGAAVEATIGDLLVPGAAPTVERRLIRAVLRASGADYALVLGRSWRSGVVTVPGQGPTLVWRQLHGGHAPSLERWALTMGDIELF